MATTAATTRHAKPQAISGLSLWVEGTPVSVNLAYGVRGRGGKYLKPEAQSWRDLVWAAFRSHPDAQRFTPDQLPLRVHCTFYGVRGDADNYSKLAVDGIKLALGIDDRFFSPITCEVARKRASGGKQGARIEVWAAERRPG